jgi:hypothetical protein
MLAADKGWPVPASGTPRPSGLYPVPHRGHSFSARTVDAAVHGPLRLDAVANDTAATMVTRRGERLDGTLEAIKGM